MTDVAFEQPVSAETSVALLPMQRPVEQSDAPSTTYADERLVQLLIDELNSPLRRLLQSVEQGRSRSDSTVLMLCGSERRIGCTSLSVATAAVAAREQPILLIDGDGVRRGLSSGLRPLPGNGWGTFVSGSVRSERVIHRMESWPGVHILPYGPADGPINDYLKAARFGRMLAQLRRQYGLIVVDAGADTGIHWSGWTDVALLVCEATPTAAGEWSSAWDALEGRGARMLGIIETRCNR